MTTNSVAIARWLNWVMKCWDIDLIAINGFVSRIRLHFPIIHRRGSPFYHRNGAWDCISRIDSAQSVDSNRLTERTYHWFSRRLAETS